MKTASNQLLRDIFGPCFSALSTVYQSSVVVPSHKIYLILKALDVFLIEVGIDWKKVAQVLLVILFFSFCSVVFYKLLTRALDIEYEAQEAVLVEYQESLKKTVPFEGE